MLRNPRIRSIHRLMAFLNEVLSLNAQESVASEQ